MRQVRIQISGSAPVRADRLIAGELPDLSRRRIRELFERGAIRADGRRIPKGVLVAPGAELTIEVEDGSALEPEAGSAVPVLYEDEALLVLDKPAGRPGHALRPDDRGTVANFLAARYPETREASENPLEHGLAHRLDTGTSGVLVVARTREVWKELRARFRRREVAKGYIALVVGSVDAPGEIDRPIAPHPRNRRRVRVIPAGEAVPAGARPAVTRYRPIARYAGASLLEIEMPTGVMHQIRAHLASIGHPVAGDGLYGAPADGRPRHLLHAASIAFRHPQTEAPLRVESPLPQDFRAALDAVAGTAAR